MRVLVDSSLWVHQFRKSGDPAKRTRVNNLLIAGHAAWCPAVRLELWRGVASDGERHGDSGASAGTGELHGFAPDRGGDWIVGKTCLVPSQRPPLADLLVFACAMVHDLDLAHDDGHFDQLAKLVE